ncbi:hypothetical protein J2X11_001440 [Aeromicrobium panaciterrae]|uniref:Uncharacterized protein n=1 Tax=Aeromicrobium panaciterrae TaxID=363861 RepID=A0ABU1UN36_9ACTN|nr:hypothetical protein [Aeromicrobium panaciterrae]MDR7086601.1 hypothetical protein [Aeromicrobium panaciterrae]
MFGYTALTVLLTAGAAQALSGSNTVRSDDIVASNVKNSDIGTSAVTSSKVALDTLTGDDINESTLVFPKPMIAFVSETAVLDTQRSSRASSAGRVTPFQGWYEVVFDRDVSTCIYQVTGKNQTVATAFSAAPRSGNANAVFVEARTVGTGDRADGAFYLTVICPS